MKVKYILCFTILVIFIASLFGYKNYENYQASKAKAAFVPAPIPVTAVKAESGDWQNYLTAVGTILAINGVNISPQLAGTVSKIDFNSGQMVTEGQLILELDTSLVQAQLDEATSAMNLANATFKRYTKLYEQKAVAESDLDAARSAYNQAVGNVNAIKAQISFMQIKAPFSGRIGLRLVNLGQYLAPGTVIATLQSVDPIWVDFPIPSQDIPQLQLNGAITLTTDSDSKTVYQGKIIAINSAVDQTTRMVTVRAEVNNPTGSLVPGMFANVKVLLPIQTNVVTVPASAVTYTLYGESIFVLTPTSNQQYTAKLVSVNPGLKQNERVVIPKGINPGDLVVTNGQLNLQNGSIVTLKTAGN